MRRHSAGGLWFGDEFGPFLLHTDATGRVLEAPIPLPDVKSPENPTLGAEEEPNLATSKGFEGMAMSESGDMLYPMLEGALEDDQEESRRFIHEFDLADGRYTGEAWQYRTEESEHTIGDFTALNDNRLLVIERDNEQGEEAGFKKVYEVDLDRTDSEGYLIKEEALDLLRIRDPNLISEPAREGDLGLGDPFSFPFQTIESIYRSEAAVALAERQQLSPERGPQPGPDRRHGSDNRPHQRISLRRDATDRRASACDTGRLHGADLGRGLGCFAATGPRGLHPAPAVKAKIE